jgi:hypothetical protein
VGKGTCVYEDMQARRGRGRKIAERGAWMDESNQRQACTAVSGAQRGHDRGRMGEEPRAHLNNVHVMGDRESSEQIEEDDLPHLV